MPTNLEHQNKYKHNENFNSQITLNIKNSIDWQIISLFYSALHLVDAYIDKYFSLHFTDHFTRNRFISNEHTLRHIYSDYMLIYMESRTVRYDDCTDCSSRSSNLNNNLIHSYNNIKNSLISKI